METDITCIASSELQASSDHPTMTSQPGNMLPHTVSEKLARALELKEEGNVLFKQQEWRRAIKKYHHSLMFIKGVTDRPDKMMGFALPSKFKKPTAEEEKCSIELLVSVHNNIAACLVKECEWEKAIHHTTKVIELRPGNVKALFRQGLCCLNLGRLDQARELLRKAEAIDQNDVGIRKQLQLLQYREREQAKTEQKMCQAMFAQNNSR